ncbi:MAG: hypothetical protein ABL921_32435, partial [Pirellula sp.]
MGIVVALGLAFFLVTVVVVVMVVSLQKEKGTALLNERLRFIEKYRFPTGLPQKIAKRRLELTSVQIDQVLEALREYFRVCLLARAPGGTPVGMPSRVVDDAWHEFILFTREYHHFCESAFGRFLHHTPHDKGTSKNEANHQLARTWGFTNRTSASNDRLAQLGATGVAAASSVPLLFAIDEMLGISDGQFYTDNDVEEFETHRKKQSEASIADTGFLWLGSADGASYSQQLDADFHRGDGPTDGGGSDASGAGDGGAACSGG